MVPFVAFAYILGRACLNFVTCDVASVLRDLRELVKALAWVLIMMGSTLLILFLISYFSTNTGHSLVEDIIKIEYGFIVVFASMTMFTAVRAWQTHHADLDILSKDGWTPTNVYSDLGDRSLVSGITCFFGQNILFIYLMGGIWSGFSKFHSSSSMTLVMVLLESKSLPSFSNFFDSFVFLVTSAFVQNLIWGQMGSSFEDNMPVWICFWSKFRGQRVEVFDTEVEKGKKNKGLWILRCLDEADDEDEAQATPPTNERAVTLDGEPLLGDWVGLRSEVSGHELVVRILMSWWVNGVLRKLVVMLVPLMLITVDSYLDFVQNATALTFIVQLDDIAVTKRFRLKTRKGSMGSTSSLKSGLLS